METSDLLHWILVAMIVFCWACGCCSSDISEDDEVSDDGYIAHRDLDDRQYSQWEWDEWYRNWKPARMCY